MPKRIQRRRTKGWQAPPEAVYVGRPTKWGNPFVLGGDGYAMSPDIAVAAFRAMLRDHGSWSSIPCERWPRGKIPAQWTTVDDVRRELRGKDLICFCPLDQPCHADVLLEIANA